MRYGDPGGGVRRACTNSDQAPACTSGLLPSQHQGPRQETSQEVLLVAVGFGGKTRTTIRDVRQVVHDKFFGGGEEAHFTLLWVGLRVIKSVRAFSQAASL